jgi:outer membrane protein OmpA-like peptidoglycan-associated protein/polyisoprenoid-binding protein YceI
MRFSIPRLICLTLISLALGLAAAYSAPSWTLDPSASTLSYQSVKKNTIVETNKLRNLAGSISSDGVAQVVVDLNSVESGIDIRDVRMRFLFFETFKFPTATVTTKLDPAAFTDLATKRRMKMTLPFTLDLHGLKKELSADVVVTMISDSAVSVASDSPIEIKVEDFGLGPAIEKLEQAGNITSILPVASVSFDFLFVADGAAKPAAAAPPAAPSAAIGPVATDASKAAYSEEECRNRLEVISRTGAIYFRTNSAELDSASRPLLAAALDVVTKCPALKIEVSGYTDSDGKPADNLRLSQRRAEAVVAYLMAAGVPAGRTSARGYGQMRPVAPNDSDKNKALNRRIEFAASPSAN